MVTAIFIAVFTAVDIASTTAGENSEFVGPTMSPSPLGFVVSDLFASYVVLAVTSFIAGIWLLAIALRRSDRTSA